MPARLAAAVGVLAVVAIASMPWWAERATIYLAVEILAMLALAQMWNLLAGYGGLLSVGQQGFVGLGAYALVVFGLQVGLNAFLVIPLAGIVGALAAALVAPLVFRLSGAHFAIGTWVVAEVFRLVVANLPFVSGGSGVSVAKTVMGMGADTRVSLTLWWALALGAGATLAVYLLLRSRWGLALVAVRDSERASRSLGVRVGRIKWAVWVAAAAGCAMTGALLFITKLRVAPDSAFSIDWTTTMFFIVVIGGIGTLEGPIIGTIAYFFLREWLADLGSVYLITLGVLTMVVMLFFDKGLWGLCTRYTRWELFPVRRRIGTRGQKTDSA
ncbi:MAG: branched-chain amino acid ABC transporter permease [Comamonadaceae bacterium]|nr:branched-chain amino acid ABC transporter permease [Burkholderiales bacterium]MEB2349527.1 branched-chain amino acid ABC transporter permease [Comamonadaceae bacterium]